MSETAEATVAYFKKELPFNPWTLSDGSRVKVEALNNQLGVVKATTELEVKELTEVANKHIGGWYLIDEAEYEELLKKKSPLKPHSRREELTSQGLREAAQARANAESSQPQAESVAEGDAERSIAPPPADPPRPKAAPKVAPKESKTE